MSGRLTTIALVSLLAGCTMAPDYRQPPMATAPVYPAEGQPELGEVTATALGWRQFFADPRLVKLVEVALDNNRDLRISVARIEEARGQYRVQRADLLPTIEGQASAVRTHGGSVSSGGPVAPVTADNYSAGGGITSFELDFWGRVRSLSNAARASYLATVQAGRAFRISLIADVAGTYLMLRETEERIALARATVDSRNRGLEIAKLRLDAGVTSALEYRQSETLLTQAQTELATLRRMRAQARNLLDVLVGGPVNGPLPAPLPLLDQGMGGHLGAGLPSDLLLNRPDILEAEQQLRASNANIGAARAAFFPKITLTGSGGYESTELKNGLAQDGMNWSLGPASLTVPIFDFGRNQGNLDVAKARQNIAVATYEKTVQTAFREVADALAARRYFADQVAAQERALVAQRNSAELAQLRYRNGVSNYLEVLDAERNLFDAEQSLVETRRNQLDNLVTLYVALGGGLTE
ncbi:efflux transporter outer membrane subunit [Emcibacter sp. SYSU 3D8]|uniref:efflux transporter outer membrane subunit n=1 Tax=Emcibacter sp. SYSU 3D8 TaxID=3133969 RepID=UPI0031FEEBBE